MQAYIQNNNEVLAPAEKHRGFKEFVQTLDNSTAISNSSTSSQGESSENNDEGLIHMASDFENFVKQKPVLIFLGSLITVLLCCVISQCMIRIAKTYRLHLNRYHSRKRYEKARLIQHYLNNEEEQEG
jgi:hypothetical protein